MNCINSSVLSPFSSANLSPLPALVFMKRGESDPDLDAEASVVASVPMDAPSLTPSPTAKIPFNTELEFVLLSESVLGSPLVVAMEPELGLDLPVRRDREAEPIKLENEKRLLLLLSLLMLLIVVVVAAVLLL